jgi:hypothetical protein
MAKLTEEQQKQLDELTALANAPDADDDEVWVENKDGHKTKLTGARAAAWLKRNGYEPDEGDKAAADADAKADEDAGKSGAASSSTPAKKAAPAKKTAPARKQDVNGDDGPDVSDVGDEPLEQDDPAPAGNRRAFF